MSTASDTKLPVMLTGNAEFDRFLMDEMLDETSIITKMLTGAGEEASALIVTMLEASFDAGRMAGQEDVIDAEFDGVFRAPVAH